MGTTMPSVSSASATGTLKGEIWAEASRYERTGCTTGLEGEAELLRFGACTYAFSVSIVRRRNRMCATSNVFRSSERGMIEDVRGEIS